MEIFKTVFEGKMTKKEGFKEADIKNAERKVGC